MVPLHDTKKREFQDEFISENFRSLRDFSNGSECDLGLEKVVNVINIQPSKLLFTLKPEE